MLEVTVCIYMITRLETVYLTLFIPMCFFEFTKYKNYSV